MPNLVHLARYLALSIFICTVIIIDFRPDLGSVVNREYLARGSTLAQNLIAKLHPTFHSTDPDCHDSTVEDLHRRIGGLENLIQEQAVTLQRLSHELRSLKSLGPPLSPTESKDWVTLMLEQHTTAIYHLHDRTDLIQSSLTDCGCSRSGSSSPHPVMGLFHTGDVRRMDQSPGNGHTTKMVSFRRPYSSRPAIAVALTSLDIANNNNIRVECYVTTTTETFFEIDVYSWARTQLYQAGCAWLEIGPDNPDFQSGTYNTQQNQRQIRFPLPYRAPPEVVVWLTRLDMRRDRPWRVKVYATSVTTLGFTINLDIWGGAELYSAGATWVSYRSGMKGVYSGGFDTTGPPRLDGVPGFEEEGVPKTGYAEFGNGVFELPPRVMVGLSMLDINCDRNLRVTVGTTAVDEEGMTWYLGTWGDTTLYSAGATYLALA